MGLSLLLSCSNNSNEENKQSHEESLANTNTSSFKDLDSNVAMQLNQVIEHYIHLKNGMVTSNIAEAKAGAKGMLHAITAIDTLKFTHDQTKAYNELIGKIKENAAHIMGSDDIEKQRGHLNPLSENTFNLIKTFGSSKTVYYEFCPMANNNRGGHWLSEGNEKKC